MSRRTRLAAILGAGTALLAALWLAPIPGAAQTTPASGVRVQQDGVDQGGRATTINCAPNIVCTLPPGSSVVTISGGGGGGAGSPGGAIGDLQINAGGGIFGGYAGATCGAGDFVSGLSTAGALTCATPAGGGGGAPTTAQYVTLAVDGTLTNERVLTGTANQVVLTDGGAGNAVTLSLPQSIHTAATPTFATLTLTGQLLAADGTLAAPGIAFASSPGTGWVWDGFGLNLIFGGALRYYVSPDGLAILGDASNSGNLSLTGTVGEGARIAFQARAVTFTPAAGQAVLYVDPTAKNLYLKDDAGVIKHGVQTATCSAGDFVSAISNAGGVTCGTPVGGGGAPASATYLTQTPDAGLSSEQALSLLGSGLMLNTTATGVVSIFAGSTCGGGTFATQISASGALTCGTPSGGGTVTHTAGALTVNQLVIGNAADDLKVLGTLGTTTTVLHGNAAGAPTFGPVVSADLSLTATSCTNQFVTAISTGGVGTCTTATLASAQFANQGTTTTVLHGHAAGNPSWGAVALAADVSGRLPYANLTAATAASRLLGRTDASAGDWQEITLGTNLSMSGTTLNASGSGGGGAPTNAQYVVLALDGTLTDERVLTGGTTGPGITITDGGAGSTVTVDITRERWGVVAADITHTPSSVALENVTGLSASVCATSTEVWQIEVQLAYTAANVTVDIKFAWSVPTGATMLWATHQISNSNFFFNPVTAGSAPDALWTEATQPISASAALTTGAFFRGWLYCSTTSGTLQLQFAQGTSNASNLVIKKGSTAIFRRVIN